MRLQNTFLPLLVFGAVLVCSSGARRVRVRPVAQEQEEETVQYYSAEPQDSREDRVVYISSADQYNGLYGQPSASSRSSNDNYIPSSRSSPGEIKSRSKESVKSPPVQTIRNYNKVNDDGSFTFGYEAADGSFKEETRGTDCVVRGKYGYIDPDGNKREFTYVSGNPCDPNAPKDERDEKQDTEEESNETENGPANYPTRPIRPIKPLGTKSPITFFQNNYAQEDQPDPEQFLKPQLLQPARPQPIYIPRSQYIPEPITEAPQIYQRPKIYTSSIPSSTPASVIFKNTLTPLSITPRPTPRTEQATTYRPPTLQLTVTPRPALLYTKPIAAQTRPVLPVTTPSPFTPNRGNLDFDAEFQKFQQENNVLAPTPSTIPKAVTKLPKPATTPITSTTGGQVYSSELIYDPTSGQYNTQLYQALPQTEGEITLNQKIQPYVHQPPPPLLSLQQLQQQSPLYRTQRPQLNQALYQQQQAELQFQNSAQLYAQQQKARQQQQLQQPSAPQHYYYIQPSLQQPSYTSGQIDAFLRGHNIQF